MTFSFTISESDFLTFQLYTLSKSDNVLVRMKRGRIFATILGAILAFNLLISDALYAGVVMTIGVLFIYLLYPKYHKWRMKKNFQKYIRRTHKDRFDQPEELQIQAKGILSKNYSGEGEIKKSELFELIEIPTLFLLAMKNGASIILPKSQLTNTELLKSELKKIGVPYRAEMNWQY